MKKIKKVRERAVAFYFKTSGILTILLLFGIFSLLLINGIKTFSSVSFSEFFLSTNWNPAAYEEPKYGVLSMVLSTFLVTAGAMIIAIPIGVATAAYLSDVAPKKVRQILKPILEMIAAIPSVAIGFLGIVLVGPFLVKIFNLSNGLTALNGSILLAVMALPTIISVSDDALRAIPHSFKEGSLALGGTKWKTLIRMTLPAAIPGIFAAIVLGMGRAIGETMAVLVATGNSLQMPEGFFDSVRTMTATIAIELGEVPYGTTHYYAIFSVGALLFIITLAVNLIAEAITAKYRWTKK